jgi:hypothetical protein
MFEAPSFEEIKMDAEISSYQDDFDPMREGPPFVEATTRVEVGHVVGEDG